MGWLLGISAFLFVLYLIGDLSNEVDREREYRFESERSRSVDYELFTKVRNYGGDY